MNQAAALDNVCENEQAGLVTQPVCAADRRFGDVGLHVVLLILSMGILLAAFFLQAGSTTVVLPFINQPLPDLCMLRRMTGMTCPGCGLTRCFISLAHGDWAAAWAYNPAGIWFFGVVALQVPYRSYQLWRISHGQRELNQVGAGQVALAVFAIALVCQWLVRMTF